METLSWSIGIFSVFIFIMAFVVLGLEKIFELEKRIEGIEKYLKR